MSLTSISEVFISWQCEHDSKTASLVTAQFVTSFCPLVTFRDLSLVTSATQRFDIDQLTMNSVYLQITQTPPESFSVLFIRGTGNACPWHFHPEYQIGLLLHGS